MMGKESGVRAFELLLLLEWRTWWHYPGLACVSLQDWLLCPFFRIPEAV